MDFLEIYIYIIIFIFGSIVGSFLNVFITNIMLTYTPNEVIFAGCDFKKSDIYYFRKYKHFTGGVSTDKNEFKNQINSKKHFIFGEIFAIMA